MAGLLAAAATTAGAADFHVAANGSDALSGTRAAVSGGDGPFATLPRALAAARALRGAEPNRATPIVIQVHGGLHALSAPVVLGPADSGTAASPLVLEAAPGETPILSGGVPIAGWRVEESGRWETTVTWATNRSAAFAQLYVNDQRRFRPTLPRNGYFYAARGADEPGPGTDFVARDGDFDPAWAREGDAVEVLLFHNWSMSRLPLRAYEATARLVRLDGGTWSPENMTKIAGATRYRVENACAAATEPGDWHLDAATGQLIYVAKPGEKPETAVVVAPRLPQVLRIEGDAMAGRFVEHIVVRGITFAHNGWTMPPGGYSFCQAEAALGAAVEVRAARHVAFEDCDVRHTATYAFWFGEGCLDARVERCEMTDLGAGGVKIGETHRNHPAAGCVVRDCLITAGGRVHPAAIGVWIGIAASNTVERNEIADFYYSAVSVGWQWNTDPTPCRDNRILNNHLHDLGQGVLSDMGGIYTLGRQPGTVLAGNRIHDVSRVDYGGWGLYFDEGSSEILETGNLAYRTQDSPFHAHACRDNVIRGNIFAFGTNGQMQFSNLFRLGPLTLENNVFVWDDAKLFAAEPDEEIVFRSNLYWRVGTTSPVTFVKGQDLAAWRAREPGAEVADPGFVAPADGDFRLKPGAAATARGMVGFDPASAGRITKTSRLAHLPPVPRAYPPHHPPPPYRLSEDFERWPVGRGWAEFEQAAAGTNVDARVTEEFASSGRRSLCLRDGPGGEGYMPHLYRSFSFTGGVVRAGIDLRLEPGACAEFEVRESVGRYHEGPHVLVRGDGTVRSADRDLARVPVGRWFRVELETGIGKQRTGTYRVTVRPPDGAAPIVADGLPCADSFTAAKWIGIASHGYNPVRFFVDNVTLSCDAR